MDILKNETVIHRKYGNGTIVEVNDRFLIIKFETLEDAKKFLYPDSFEGFMTFQNGNLQEEAIRLIDMKKADKKSLEEFKIQEYERRKEERRSEKLDMQKKQRKTRATKSTKEKAGK